MEFLIINSNKLKVMMNKGDMAKYGIDPKDADYENPKARRAFWRVLDVAKDECGFDISGDKLLIQFYPSAEGSEMFVTKLGKIGSNAERSIAKSQNVAMLTSRNKICRFASLSAVLSVARGFSDEAEKAYSELYYSDDGCFYLCFEERGSYGMLGELSILSEFSAEVPHTLEPYIIEHSKKISENGNAFSILKSL